MDCDVRAPLLPAASLHQRLLDRDRAEADLSSRLSQCRSELEAARSRLYSAETEAASARRQQDATSAEHSRHMR